MLIVAAETHPAYLAQDAIESFDSETMLMADDEGPGNKLGKRADLVTVDGHDDVALTEALPVRLALLPHQTHAWHAMVGHEGDVQLLIIYTDGNTGKRLKTHALLPRIDNHGTILQDCGTNVRLALCGQSMQVAEIDATHPEPAEMEEYDLAERLHAEMTDGVAPHAAPLHLTVYRAACHGRAGIETLTVHGIETTAAGVEKYLLTVVAKGTGFQIRYKELERITGVEALLMVEELLAVSEYQQPLTNIDLCQQPAIDDIETKDAIHLATFRPPLNGALLHGSLTAAYGNAAERHGWQDDHRHLVDRAYCIVGADVASSLAALDGRVGIDYRLCCPRVEEEAVLLPSHLHGHIDLSALPLYLDGIDEILCRQREFPGVAGLLYMR